MRVLSLAAISLAIGCGHHSAPEPVDPGAAPMLAPKETVAAAKGALESWRQAYDVRSLDALEKLYQHDLDLVVVEQGVPLIGWSSVDAMLKDRLARATEIRVRLVDIHVAAITSDVASVVATMTREIADGPTNVADSGTLTLVLHQVGGVWLIASEHYSYRPHSG